MPLYILGSSTDSAHLAAQLGLPYVFAGHFAPQQMKEAIEIYKTLFEPSDVLDEPYVIVCLNTIVAENDDEAQYLASSMAQVMVSITRGRMQPVQPPTHDLQYINAERICDGYGKTENIINRFRKYCSTKNSRFYGNLW